MTWNTPCFSYINHCDRVPTLERIRDPVTGAVRWRPVTCGSPMVSDSSGKALPGQCTIVNCRFAGQPHLSCQQLVWQWSTPCAPRTPCLPCEPHSCNTPFSTVLAVQPQAFFVQPQVFPVASTPGPVMARWLSTKPNWHLPTSMPANWQRASDRRTSGDRTPGGFPRTPGWRTPAAFPHTPFASASQTPARGGDLIPVAVPRDPSLPSRRPDFVEWNNISGGNLTWTPQPWIAHPLPHPNIPAQQFWGQGTPWQAWQGPGGQTPGSPGIITALTGGHPLPGSNPLWTPGAWHPGLFQTDAGAPVQLSPWLIPNPRSSTEPSVLWDLTENPSRIKRLTSRGSIVPLADTENIKQQASSPPVRDMHIIIPYMHVSWGPAVISKSDTITVADVFDAVYAYLQKPLSFNDLAALYCSPGGLDRWDRIEYAAWRRCSTASSGLPDFERAQGYKRIDLFEGSTVFWGMWTCYRQDGSWYLTIGLRPAEFFTC